MVFSRNDAKLAATPGAVGVLHTHSRRLDLHPHVHMVMPAAALNGARELWHTKCPRGGGYLFNQKALAKVFRAKLLDANKATGLTLPAKLPAVWVVDREAVGDGSKALLYLGRYLYRSVVQESDILSCKDGQVSFRYRDAKTSKAALRTLPGEDFLWLVLQRVSSLKRPSCQPARPGDAPAASRWPCSGGACPRRRKPTIQQRMTSPTSTARWTAPRRTDHVPTITTNRPQIGLPHRLV